MDNRVDHGRVSKDGSGHVRISVIPSRLDPPLAVHRYDFETQFDKAMPSAVRETTSS